jgi:cytochrome P450
MGALAVQFSWFIPLMNSFPDRLTKLIDPHYNPFLEFKRGLEHQIQGVIARYQQGKDNKTVFDEILNSNLPDYEKRPERLLEESQNIAIAGTETTAWALSVIQFHLLSNPKILRKLKDELKSAMPDPNTMLSLKQAEQLPYLTAVITEGLRIGLGTTNCKTRIAPDEVLVLKSGFGGKEREWRIPPGTPVSMSTPLVHLNPEIFPEPLEFRPERFIENPKLKRYLMSFALGSRQCLGMQLAYGELYLVLAGVWRRFGGLGEGCVGEEGREGGNFELFGTDREDVEMRYGLFVPYGKKDSKGIRVVVK